MASASLVRNDRLEVPPVAVANGGMLPSDVVYEILLRLPADEVCRSRLVCRSWRSLTYDRLFAIAHSLMHHPLLVGLHHSRHEIHVVDLSGNILKRIRLTEPAGSSLVSTHGDLVCVSSSSSETSGEACMLNLATGAATILPGSISCEPSMRPNPATYTLGHVPSTNEYKVLRIHMYLHQHNRRFKTICHVTTLGDPRWRDRPYAPVIVAPQCTAVIDGIAYFSVCQILVNTEPDCIAAFDMALEEWKPTVIKGPLSSRLSSHSNRWLDYKNISCFRLAGLSGSLVVVHQNIEYSSTDLWFLEDIDKALWTKRYSLWWMPDLRANNPTNKRESHECIYPLVSLRDGRILVWVEEEEARVLRAYDLKSRTWTGLATVKDYCAVGMHHGSLLCPGL